MFAKAGKLSAQDLVKLSEQCSALAKDREAGRAEEEAALPGTEDVKHQVRRWGNISPRQRHIFELCCAGPNIFNAGKKAAQSPGPFPRPISDEGLLEIEGCKRNVRS